MQTHAVDHVAQATALAEQFAATAAERDRAAGTPRHERDLIRQSGLLRLMVPVEHGGLGGTWPTLMRAVRELARADGSLAHLFGYHHLELVTPHLIGTLEQRERFYALTARHNWFWGNALNPLDTRTSLIRSDGQMRISGSKSFCTGARDSDVLLVSALEPGQTRIVVAVVPTDRAGISVRDDWDNMGQRQTDSGSVTFEDVMVYQDEVLGPPGAGGSTFATLRPCITQLILTNIYLGVAQGAFETARGYTATQARPFAASGVERAADDPYTLHHYGEMWVSLSGVACLADQASSALQDAWVLENDLTPEQRGECAVTIFTAKSAAGKVALDVTSRVFDVMGSRATAEKYRHDRFWRNVRTLTLHDPLDYKLREVGDWVLNGTMPTPSFYS
jgi:alkylation response protein AidB-like acyl-CoA dehydrogenase